MSVITKYFHKLDNRLSAKIYNMKYSWTMDYCLYIPGVIFNNPIGMVAVTALYAIFFVNVEKDIKRMI